MREIIVDNFAGGGGASTGIEMADNQHEELLLTILQSKAKIIISGYENDMYNDYLKEWNKKSFQSNAEYGLKREEVIWFNFETDKQMNLFDFIGK